MGKRTKPPAHDARDERFVAEYLKDLNVPRAAVAAGFAETTARTLAYMWVTDPKAKPAVYTAIRKKLDARLAKIDLSSERILEEIARVAFFNVGDILDPKGKLREIDLTNLTVEQAAALGEVSLEGRGKNRRLKVKPWNKMEALGMLAKYRNLLAPDAAVTVNVNANVGLAERVARATARALAKDKA